jgi:hypothetical protein
MNCATPASRGQVLQSEATHASKVDGKSDQGSPTLRRIATVWHTLPGLLSGIGWRLLVRVLFFSSVITLLLTLTQLYLDYHRDVRAVDQRMSEIDSSYRQSLGEGLWRMDTRQLRLQVEGILHLPDISYVEVREATDRPAPLVVSAGSHQAKPSMRSEFKIFYANRGAEQLLGTLAVEATFDRIYRRLLGTAAVIMVGQAIKTFVVSFFILLIVHRLITRHLIAIATSLRGYDLRGSQEPLRLERHSPRRADELDSLVGTTRCTRGCKSLTATSKNGRQRFDALSTPTSSEYASLILTVVSWRPTTRFSVSWAIAVMT